MDTSAWYSLADRGDANHTRAERCFGRLIREEWRLVTSNHIVAETYTLLRMRLGAIAARQFLWRTRRSAVTERVFVPDSWEEAAEDLLIRYADQDFSYVDATSFVAMQRLGVDDAFAFDHHFAVLGFQLLAEED